MAIYYSFTSTGTYTGTYDSGTNSIIEPIGDICQVGGVLKLSEGTSAWNNIEDITFSNGLNIKSMSGTDWDSAQKTEWMNAYFDFYQIPNVKSDSSWFSELLSYAESIDLFQTLSGPSIGFVNQSTSGSQEIQIYLNVYEIEWVFDYVDGLSDGNALKTYVLTNKRSEDNYISNVAKVTWGSKTRPIWAFGGIVYNYTISHNATLTSGGGNIFGEVKLGGTGKRTHYIVKKDVDDDDPTVGLCSGVGGPFCMGDNITIIDNSTYTSGTNGSAWTWIGDFSQIDYTWYIADVSDPCTYYNNVPVDEIFFPIRIIQFCKFENFS